MWLLFNMVQKIINLYSFNELTEDAKQKAINNLSDINVDYNWWESIYEDAKTIGLKITSFDLDRNRHCKGEFTLSAREVAEKIISEHGESCNTYKTAYKFIEDADGIEEELPIKMDDEEGEEIDYDFNEDERDMQLHELECKFLKSLLEDYSMILQKECDYLMSDKAIIETINANEYTFTEDGKLENL